MFRSVKSVLTMLLAIAVSAGVVGCSEKITDTVNNTGYTRPEPAPDPGPQGPTGFIKLTLDQPIETQGCYLTFETFTTSRPSTLKIASYADPEQEEFPSVMLQAQVDVDSATALAGASIQAEAYVMTAEGGAVWHSIPGMVEVKITSVTGSKVVGEIVGGELENTFTKAKANVTGTFDGTI